MRNFFIFFVVVVVILGCIENIPKIKDVIIEKMATFRFFKLLILINI